MQPSIQTSCFITVGVQLWLERLADATVVRADEEISMLD
jgi:hypothetical protein